MESHKRNLHLLTCLSNTAYLNGQDYDSFSPTAEPHDRTDCMQFGGLPYEAWAHVFKFGQMRLVQHKIIQDLRWTHKRTDMQWVRSPSSWYDILYPVHIWFTSHTPPPHTSDLSKDKDTHFSIAFIFNTSSSTSLSQWNRSTKLYFILSLQRLLCILILNCNKQHPELLLEYISRY